METGRSKYQTLCHQPRSTNKEQHPEPGTDLAQHVPPPAGSLGAGLEDKQEAEPTKQFLAASPPTCLLHRAPSTQTKRAPVFLCRISLGSSQGKSCWFYHYGNVFSLEVEQCRREDACRWQPASTAQCLWFCTNHPFVTVKYTWKCKQKEGLKTKPGQISWGCTMQGVAKRIDGFWLQIFQLFGPVVL